MCYDHLGQLVSVTRTGDGTYTYAYDNGGNIQSVTLNGVTIKSYGYDDANWKDKLTSFNGQEITYDDFDDNDDNDIGNPLQYRDGFNFAWSNGRQLTGVTKGTDSISYSYNADGLRTSKNVNGTITEYYWLEGVLLGQKTGNDYIIYLYDENGSAYGIICNNTYYYYVFNAQGDVVGIINSDGTQVAQYDYSAWGEVLAVTGEKADTIGQLNPIRYRGYYYDSETGFYYLQSRYCDPVTQRFLNADSVVASVSASISGYNLFAYCFNNPVNMTDSSGSWPTWNDIKNGAKKAYDKVTKAAERALSAFTLELGVGTGLKGGIDAGGASIDAGIKSDSITVILNSEHSKIGQRQEAEATIGIGTIAIGPSQSDWIPASETDSYETDFNWISDVTVLEYGIEFYFFYGGTVNLSIDLDVLSEGLVMIFE